MSKKHSLYRDKVTIPDMYLRYPYKWYDTDSSTIPYPYFSKDQITNHKHTLSYKEYRKIIAVYLKLASKSLLKNIRFDMPKGLGYLELRKHRRRYKKDFVNWPATWERKVLTFRPKTLVGHKWCVLIKWYRNEQRLKHKFLWRFINNTDDKDDFIAEQLKNNPSYINRLKDV